MGRDGIRFFTEQKNVTTTWFRETVADEEDGEVVDTWDGTITSLPGKAEKK
jgi:malonate-semialdehyde dehydrogenase (acetylating)/methylmalonate-semialdehyde dehydrogenase